MMPSSPIGSPAPINPAKSNRSQLPSLIVAVLISCPMLWWHGRECRARFPTDPTPGSLPFTEFDHPFHYYYSTLTRDFFANRTAFWGYDPTFMAGYAKTLIFPTSSSMAEIVAIAGARSPSAYRTLVASVLWLVPLFLGFAARTASRHWSAFAIATGLSIVWIWCGFPSSYAAWGMGPFIWASAASIWAACLLARWLDEPERLTIIGGGMLATIATIAHPSSPVILVFMLAPAYVARFRSLSSRQHLIAWLIPLFAILAWSPWWLPVLVLRDSFGTTASGFINENIVDRLLELARAKFPEESALLVVAVCAVPILAGCGCAVRYALAGGAALLFATAYFGSFFQFLWSMQPGRYTQPLYAVMVVAIATGIAQATVRFIERPIQTVSWRAVVTLCAGSLVGACLVFPKAVAYWRTQPHAGMRFDLPPEIDKLIVALRELNDGSGRVLFEDFGRGLPKSSGPFLWPQSLNPYGGTNPSALLPLLAPGQYIGGPYLYTHLKSNFTQFGDGKLCERPVNKIDRDTFDRYARLYNVRCLVAWSPPMITLAELNPDLFRPVGRYGITRLYEVMRTPNWAVRGTAAVKASADRLEVFDASPDSNGELILSYHWISTLRSNAAIRPVLLEDDPVPFIAVDGAPNQFVVDNRLW